MGYVIGVCVAMLVAGFARVVGLDRDRGFYPTVLVVVASYYVLFAVMGGSTRAVVLELTTMGVFVLAAVAGLKHASWIVLAGLAAHGVFDFLHASIVSNPGVPEWWPAFCGAYDVAAPAIVLVTRLASKQTATVGQKRLANA
jgi:hypothetical protein